jgi:hypothetical protein
MNPYHDGETEIPVCVLTRRIKVHLSTVHRWRLENRLDCFRIGGRWMVSKEAWERFVSRCNSVEQKPNMRSVRSPRRREKDLARVDRELTEAGF